MAWECEHCLATFCRLARGFVTSRRIISQFQPEVMLFTGGYVAVPMALAGKRIPTLSYVPDIEPGLALKTLARASTRIAITTEESRRYFSPKAHLSVTGYPVRTDLMKWSRSDAFQVLNLQANKRVLLVAGGSKGARSINKALNAILPEILKEFQVIHLSGQLDWQEIQASCAKLPSDLLPFYHPFPYLHEMGAALASADLVISRAGASTLGEYPLFGLPAILVPYPYAWRYQSVNAEFLARKGAAVIIEDSRLADLLHPTILSLIGDEGHLETMRSAMRSLSHPQSASTLAAELVELASQTRRRG